MHTALIHTPLHALHARHARPSPIRAPHCGRPQARRLAPRPGLAHRRCALHTTSNDMASSSLPPACDSSFLEHAPPADAPAPVLIVLNYALPALTARLWSRACLTICADGGANRLYDAAPTWCPDQAPDAARRALAPAAIVGDLDSLAPAVRAFYEGAGVAVVDLAPDQDTTDLQKCLAYAAARAPRAAPCIALGALGGRLDHTLAAMNLLFGEAHGDTLILAGDGCLARRVPAGGATLRPAARVEGPGCGLLALTPAPVPVTTAGLAWDLGPGAGVAALAWGGAQSTSNRIEGARVTVDAAAPLLWTTALGEEDA